MTATDTMATEASPPRNAAKARKSAAADAGVEAIRIPQIATRIIEIPVIGISPLIVHRFSEKGRREMEDRQQGKPKHRKAPKNPEEEFWGCLHDVPGSPGTWGFPAGAWKLACVSASRYTEGLKMTYVRGAFHVLGDLVPILDPDTGEPAKISYPANCRKDIVRVGPSKVADVRYRPQFDRWMVKLQIRYNVRAITASQIADLLNMAGFSVGVGEWRPESRGAGSFGMFEVQAAAVVGGA